MDKKDDIDLKINGRLFPTWIMKHFKKYMLPEIIRKDGEDPCSIVQKKELRKYQEFVGQYITETNIKSVLIYHGLGSGKTATCINIINVCLSDNPNTNIFLLIKASLHDEPWMKDLLEWLKNEKSSMKNIYFVHYDSPFADKDFMEIIKKSDANKKNLYIIDECHNFIRNVHGNISSNSTSGRASNIYNYILGEKKNNQQLKIVAVSATPIINEPYELALLFNLLRPTIFPTSEDNFNHFYVNDALNSINPRAKNMFQRRILGLVSYYTGSTPDLYAQKTINYINLEMSKYQTDVYKYFEDIEDALQKKKSQYTKNKNAPDLFRSYTRQACNFVFPFIDDLITGENRPRPSNFKISEKDALAIDEGKGLKMSENKGKEGTDKLYIVNIQKYTETITLYTIKLKQYLLHKKNMKGPTIEDDVIAFKKYFEDSGQSQLKNSFVVFYNQGLENRSELFKTLYTLSPKMLCSIFYILLSTGPTLFYSNYVRMEGLEIFKIYLSLFNITEYNGGKISQTYTEFHGSIDKDTRKKNLKAYNQPANKDGSIIKIILISPSGSEGINLENVRQVHLLEAYWNEIRMQQIIGRAVRQCSHKSLPMGQRKVEVFRYKVTKNAKRVGELIAYAKEMNKKKEKNIYFRTNLDIPSTDVHIEASARNKNNLNETFLLTMKESAFDCQLFKNHNSVGADYKCFQFSENVVLSKNTGPAYKDYFKEDLKLNEGLNSENSTSQNVRVRKISGITKEGETPVFYWLYEKSHTIYDYDLFYPVGKLKMENGVPLKIDKNYLINVV